MANTEDTTSFNPPPSQPNYPQMIMSAIEGTNPKEGANKTAISAYIESNYPDLPPAHSTLLSNALDKMKQAGQLVFSNNSYTRVDPNAPPKRGRGRPPKPKTGLSAVKLPGSSRPRGRPPKPRDPLAPPPQPKKKSPSGRPRGRPRKSPQSGVSVSVVPVPVSGGVKRGRGRPRKT